jgi:hypothetical protein
MAELIQLESKLAEVNGLARAAQDSTRAVAKLVDDKEIKRALEQMGAEAKETADRVYEMNEQAGDDKIGELARWALEIQRRRFEQTREAALKLAAQEDPNEPDA